MKIEYSRKEIFNVVITFLDHKLNFSVVPSLDINYCCIVSRDCAANDFLRLQTVGLVSFAATPSLICAGYVQQSGFYTFNASCRSLF